MRWYERTHEDEDLMERAIRESEGSTAKVETRRPRRRLRPRRRRRPRRR